MNRPKILAVDDDQIFLDSLKKVLEMENYKVDVISASPGVAEALQNNDYDAVLLDVKMPGVTGLELLNLIESLSIGMPVIVVSGQSTISTAVEAIKLGAYDFIEKPVDTKRLSVVLKNALSYKSLVDEKASLLNELRESNKIVGSSKAIKQVWNDIKTIAPTQARVLITGESGTGKELVAWALHHNSERRDKPYIKINCAAIPSDLLESQLFGHKRGSFTGANEDRIGKFEAADGGTLFLDEIGDLDIGLQAKILRAIEEGEIEKIGSNSVRKVDVRFIAATNQNLEEKVEEGKFRRDLYHRLNVVQIVIPPLRERLDDIVSLSHHFLNKYSEEYNRKIIDITPQAIGMLKQYNWPGNVRELRSVIENIVIFGKDERIGLDDVISAFKRLNKGGGNGNSIRGVVHLFNGTLKEARDKFERDFIYDSLEKHNWKINETAEALGIDRTNLFKKMQKHNIVKNH